MENKLVNFLANMEIVENITAPGQLKVSGKDIHVCKVDDEFFRCLIAEIPNMYKLLKILSKSNGEELTHVVEDVKGYLSHKEKILAVLAKESNQLKEEIDD